MIHHQRTCLFISHMQQGNFNSSVGPDGYMLSAVTCGMSPVTSITEGLQQVKPGEIASSDMPKLLHFCNFTNSNLACADRHHGIVPHHRPLLPGELRQHRAPLHDSEGAVESGGQEGITAALPSTPLSLPALSTTTTIPSLTCTSAQLWWRGVGGYECISDVNFKYGRCLLFATPVM